MGTVNHFSYSGAKGVKPEMELENLVTVITGAGRGIGKVIAEKFFKEGAKIAIWDVDGGSAQATAGTLDPSGQRTLSAQVDVTREEEVTRAVSGVVQRFSRIDIMVNNAGRAIHNKVEEMSLEDFESVVKLNLTGVFICCKAVTPVMKMQRSGKIINISSLGGRTGRPGVGVNYAASKAGVIGLTQTLAKELGPSGIYVNTIAPGPVMTGVAMQSPPAQRAIWNAGRVIDKDGLPEDVADAAIFLASHRSDWVTGITLDVNGGILIR
jgi:NAD(P)-dependent dehydrogenase (short-subunit alcohol dehydrogenase family)